MANKSGGNAAYILIGVAIAAAIAIAFFLFQESNEPDLSIDVGENGIEVETN